MRLRHIKGAEEQIAESPYVIQDPQGLKGKWHEFFGNQNPIRIEVGMGKGKFIMELAEKNPDVNYIGIERAVKGAPEAVPAGAVQHLLHADRCPGAGGRF